MEFDPDSGQPTFRLRPGAPGGSEALALARRLGLPAAWLDRAEELLGAEHRDLRRLLAEVETVRSQLAASAEAARQEAARLGEERAVVEREREALAAERRKLRSRLRAELDAFQRRVTEQLRDELERMRREVAGGRHRHLVAESTGRLFAEAPFAPEPEGGAERPPVVGDRVRHRGLGWEGVVRAIGGGAVEVVVAGKRLRCSVEDLLTLDGEAAQPAGPAGPAVTTPDSGTPARELKLLGQRVEPALDELDQFLDRALLASVAEVRVVHGHGSGRLRDAVREHLRGHPAVGSFRPGRRNEGGDGATVVTLAG